MALMLGGGGLGGRGFPVDENSFDAVGSMYTSSGLSSAMFGGLGSLSSRSEIT